MQQTQADDLYRTKRCACGGRFEGLIQVSGCGAERATCSRRCCVMSRVSVIFREVRVALFSMSFLCNYGAVRGTVACCYSGGIGSVVFALCARSCDMMSCMSALVSDTFVRSDSVPSCSNVCVPRLHSKSCWTSHGAVQRVRSTGVSASPPSHCRINALTVPAVIPLPWYVLVYARLVMSPF